MSRYDSSKRYGFELTAEEQIICTGCLKPQSNTTIWFVCTRPEDDPQFLQYCLCPACFDEDTKRTPNSNLLKEEELI